MNNSTISNLEYKHLALYAGTNIKLTLIRSYYCGGELIEHYHDQRVDDINFYHGFESLHTEPYSRADPINRYYLELIPIETFIEMDSDQMKAKYGFEQLNIYEIRQLCCKSIKPEQLTYSTVMILVKNHIDFLNYIELGIAIDKTTIVGKTTIVKTTKTIRTTKTL